ncbi:MAG: GDSL-type esterase/lipase family protein [Balneolales bacterium]
MWKTGNLLTIFIIAAVATAQSQDQIPDPDPLRFEAQINEFTAWDEKNDFPEEAVLFVGSSSIRMWETEQAFPEMPVINRGFGGSHISDVDYFYERIIKKYNPSIIVFYAGENDVSSGKSVRRVLNDYQNITKRILADIPHTRILFMSVKQSGSRADQWTEMDVFNQLVFEYSRSSEQLFFIDMATPLFNSIDRADDELFLDDRLHLNKKGYTIWNRVIKPDIYTLFGKQ